MHLSYLHFLKFFNFIFLTFFLQFLRNSNLKNILLFILWISGEQRFCFLLQNLDPKVSIPNRTVGSFNFSVTLCTSKLILDSQRLPTSMQGESTITKHALLLLPCLFIPRLFNSSDVATDGRGFKFVKVFLRK